MRSGQHSTKEQTCTRPFGCSRLGPGPEVSRQGDTLYQTYKTEGTQRWRKVNTSATRVAWNASTIFAVSLLQSHIALRPNDADGRVLYASIEPEALSSRRKPPCTVNEISQPPELAAFPLRAFGA